MSRPVRSPTRGQSETLAALLILAIVMIGISVVLVAGGQGLDSSSQTVHAEQTQRSLVDLASNIDEITHGSSSSQSAELDLDLGGNQGNVAVRESAGSLEVTTGGATIYNNELGAVVYTNEDLTIAYQAGGVWRHDGGGTIMVSAPGLSDRGSAPSTLTVPIIQVTGDATLTQRAAFEKEATNPLYPPKEVAASDTINIRIESQFADAWATFFIESLDIDESDVTVSNGGTVVEAQYASSEEAYFHVTHYRVDITDG